MCNCLRITIFSKYTSLFVYLSSIMAPKHLKPIVLRVYIAMLIFTYVRSGKNSEQDNLQDLTF